MAPPPSSFREAQWQRGVVHFYRNIQSRAQGQVGDVARMVKAIPAEEDRRSAQDKIREVIDRSSACHCKVPKFSRGQLRQDEKVIAVGASAASAHLTSPVAKQVTRA